MNITERKFNWWTFTWSDTGERPALICLAFAAVFFCGGYVGIVDERAGMAIFCLLACGMNLGRFGMRNSG